MRLNLKFFSRRPAQRGIAARLFPRTLLLAGLVGLGVGGCATGDISMVAPVVGGEKVRVPLGRDGVALTNEDGVQIHAVTFNSNPEKKLLFFFSFTDSRKRPLRSVRVADVSDEVAAVMVDSAQPTLSDKGEWHGQTEPLELSDRRLTWFATIPNTLRVFRFTLTFADGKTLVLHQGTLYPAAIKSAVRQSLGEKY